MRKVWMFAAAVLLFAGSGGVAGAAYRYGSDDRLPPAFSVGGMQVGGMPADAAIEQVRARITEMTETKVQAELPGGKADAGADAAALPALTLGQLGMSVSADEGIAAMEQYLNQSWWERLKRRLQGDVAAEYGVTVAWDDAAFEREARKSWAAAVYAKPHNASREINDHDEVVYTAEVTGSELDVPSLMASVKRQAPGSLAEMSGAEALKVKLPITVTAPPVTVASLKEEGIDRKIAEFTTSFQTSGAGRSHNVTAAAKALNDTLLMPGDVFEYGKIVKKAGREYGYQEAPVIVNGKLSPGVGGGICQVSSTLYNAVLLAGLDIVERRNHSLMVSYLPPGLDATYADGYINFRFRNSTGKQLLIRTVVHDKQVTVKLFGTMADNVTYRTVTEQVRVVQPKIKYVGNDKLSLGMEQLLQKGKPGFVYDTYRIKYVDGQEVSREKLPRSSYRAQDELIAVHPDDPRLQPPDTTPPPPAPAEQSPVEPV